MFIKQISIFMENKMGRLAEITKILADNNVNIQAMSIADTTDFGILRLIVDEPGEALESLKASGLTVKETEVVAISLQHKPGGLSDALRIFGENNISIEYIYDFAKKTDPAHATLILRLSDQNNAVRVIKDAGITILDWDTLKNLD